VVGVLPLVHAKTPMFGDNLISTAFSVGGGLLIDDVDVADALSETAIAMGNDRKVETLELRSEKARFEGPAKKARGCA